MDFDTLEAFIEVAERQSFSKSAKALHLTQPAISKRVAALESRLSTRLFDRVGRKVHLTEAGRLLLPTAVQIRFEVSRIEDVICNIGKTVNGKLTIGATEYIAAKQLCSVMKDYKELFDEVDLDLRVASSEETIANVATGAIEIALCPLHQSSLRTLSPKLRYTELFQSDLQVAVANTNSLALNPTTTLDTLIQTTAILPPKDKLARKAIDEILTAHEVEAKVSVEANDFSTMRSLASAGLGWTLLPESEIDDSLTRVTLNEVSFPHSVTLIRQRDMTLSRAADAFIGTLPINPSEKKTLESTSGHRRNEETSDSKITEES